MEIFLLLMIKHAIVDLGMQPFGLRNIKLRYFGWKAHQQHYIPHGVLTMLILALYGPLELAVALGFLDYILHWHTDYSKSHIRGYFGLTIIDRKYWLLNMVDQMFHYLGYYIIVILAGI